jgi:hypothetical protein
MKLQRWRVVVVVLILGTCAMRPGMAGAYHYEASSTARVADSVIDVHRVPAPFETLGRGGSAPRPADAQQTYMSPYARGVATNTARGGAGPVRVGQQGLDALGVTQNTTRIALPGGGYRVPDILDEAAGVIGEVKNVQSLSYTSQLRDYVAYAQVNQLQFDLYVRGSTQLSGPLQQAVDDGLVNLWRSLPG